MVPCKKVCRNGKVSHMNLSRGKVKRTNREWFIVPVVCFDFPFIICCTKSNSDDTILPYFLLVFAVVAIAGRRRATKAEVIKETHGKAIRHTR